VDERVLGSSSVSETEGDFGGEERLVELIELV